MNAPLILTVLLTAAPSAAPSHTETTLKQKIARFAPVELSADLSSLPANERQALSKIVAASQVMDALFLRQSWAGNLPLFTRLASDNSPLGRLQLKSFFLNKGPWDRIDNVAFIPGVPSEPPPQATFYPPDVNKAEMEKWFAGLSDLDRKLARGFYSVVRRGANGKLMVVPYNLAYQEELALAAGYLHEAAQLTAEPTLKSFLTKRAHAFVSNDYYDSEVAWMDLDSAIEPTIGPYEVYEDEWFNAKAAFEAFVAIRDEAETQKVARFSAELQDVEDHLPIDAALRNPKLGSRSPIRVVNSIYSAGDGNRGVQTAAYNLPNDERVTAEKGTKRVMMRNVQEAKFKNVLLPIAKTALDPADLKAVSFDAFFTHILMHELMHGLGPHDIQVAGKATTVREAMQNSYSSIEEAKADVSGLFALQYLVNKGVIDKDMERTMYVTFLASTFRTLRFGLTEAHGRGMALQLNYIVDRGGIEVGKNGRFRVVPAKFKEAVSALTRELMTVQGTGNRQRAEELIRTLGVIRPEAQHVLDSLQRIPVDIEPKYVTAEKLLSELRSTGLQSSISPAP